MKYQKKPVIIDAFQYDGDLIARNELYYIPVWAQKARKSGVLFYGDAGEMLYIKTLEGDMHASVGDYIIKGVHGELYPCKPDIFAKTYEQVHCLTSD